MARSQHDSQLELIATLPPRAEAPSDPTAGLIARDDLPVLDLTSAGPLSIDLDALADEVPCATAQNVSPRWLEPGTSSTIWLEGNVLMCACPDCGAPMSVRLWLMVADCWQCGTSIELSEEQQREARQLLAQRRHRHAPPSQSVPPSATGYDPQAAWDRTPAPQRRADPEGRRAKEEFYRSHVSVSPPPIQRPVAPPVAPSREPRHAQPALAQGQHLAPPPHASARVRTRRDFSRLLEDMPAWLVSLVFHLVVLTLLAMMTGPDNKRAPHITLSLAVSRNVREGDTDAWLSEDEIQFDLPIPQQEPPPTRRELSTMIEAQEDARRLRTEFDPTNPNLPHLDQVKRLIVSGDKERRLLATRDPRMRTELLRHEGGTTRTEAAVARGLDWMAAHQNSDGSWSLDRFHRHPDCQGRCGGRGHLASDAAATSLVLLPFLGAGQTHVSGYYRDTVSAGLRWLLDSQTSDGDLRAGSPDHAGMYVHGQATIVLCEALGITHDETFRKPAQRAVDFLVAAQHLAGGWRYRPGEEGDTSVLGWQLMALQSAKAAGLEVPPETLENAGHFLDRVGYQDGALYAYQPGNRPSPPMTAEGLLCRVYLGWSKDHPGLVRGVNYLLGEHAPSEHDPNYYYWYYATQVMHQFGGTEWEMWNLKMREVLIGLQETRRHKAGSWAPRGGLDRVGGRLYTTALAVCCLEVYYRHAPIFRQIRLEEQAR